MPEGLSESLAGVAVTVLLVIKGSFAGALRESW